MGRGTSPTRFKTEFCRRVKAAREFRGLSQSEAANELGVSTNTYSTYERRTLIPHYLLPQACKVFGVKADYFFAADVRAADVDVTPKRSAG